VRKQTIRRNRRLRGTAREPAPISLCDRRTPWPPEPARPYHGRASPRTRYPVTDPAAGQDRVPSANVGVRRCGEDGRA